MTTVLTDRAMGIIIKVAAELDTHMLKTAVATMKPRMMALGRSPTRDRIISAIRLCRPQRSRVKATIMPPSSR